MKKSLILFYMFYFCLGAMAQEVNLTKGASIEAAKNLSEIIVLKSDETGKYILQRGSKGFSVIYTLTHFDKLLKVTRTVTLKPLLNKEELDVESVFFSNDKLLLFSTLKDKKNSKKILYCQSIEKSTFALNNDLKKILEGDFFGFFNMKNCAMSVKHSPDGSQIIIMKECGWDKEALRKMSFLGYDHGVNILWEKEVTIPYKAGRFMMPNFDISNKGLITISGELSDYVNDRIGFPETSLNNHYKIFVVTKEGLNGEYDVNIENQHIKSFDLKISEDGNIVCTGFYGKKLNSDNIDGTFFIKIDPQSKKIVKSYYEIPIELFTKYVSAKEEQAIENKVEKGKDLVLYDYYSKGMVLRKDGGAYLVAEQNNVSHTIKQASTTGQASNKFYFYDIILISYDKNGVIQWYENIPKKQITVDDDSYCSFTKLINNDEMYFFFNDHVDNLKLWPSGKVKDFTLLSKGCVTMVKIGKDGKQERKILDQNIMPPMILSGNSKQVNEKEMLFYNYGSAKDCWFSGLLLK